MATSSSKSDRSSKPFVGRYAPSPTGRIHAGNIYASLLAYLVAKRSEGAMVLRIEDLDPERSRQTYIDAIFRDYEFLGLEWEGEVLYQSRRTSVYEDALHEIEHHHHVYECFCTRADIRSTSAPHRGEKTVYAGTCRGLSLDECRQRRNAGRAPALRIEVPKAHISLTDAFQGNYAQNLATDCGDFILRRNDGAFAYQLAVVVDDAAQGVTSVVRGVDLLPSTPQQIYLQRILHVPTPAYGHLPLLVAQKDRRLSKRNRDASLDELLFTYHTAEGVIGHIAAVAGIIPEEVPISASELVSCADLEGLCNKIQILWRA